MKERERRPARAAARGAATASRRDANPVPAGRAAIAWVGPALLAAIVLFAPPAGDGEWAVNGFRAVGPAARLGMIAAAIAAALLARVRRPAAWAWAAGGVAAAVALATLGRERIHFLGDTETRFRSLGVATSGALRETFEHWTHVLHAQPVDFAVNWLVPYALRGAGLPLAGTVEIVSIVLAILFGAAVWQVAGALSPRAELRAPIVVALLASGIVEAFAGYFENAGLMLAVGAWWWVWALAPLDGPRRVVRLALWTALAALCHRQGYLLVVAVMVRALGPPLAGDRPQARRALALASVPAVLVAFGVASLLPGGSPLSQDLGDFGALLAGWAHGRRIPAISDVLGLAVLVTPLTLLAPGFGRPAASEGPRRTAATVALAIAATLLPALALILTGPHELGAQRDWDVVSFLGFSLTVSMAARVASLPLGRARAALAAAAPALALVAAGWVAVNADVGVAAGRAAALARRPEGLAGEARSSIEEWLGDRAMRMRDAADAADHFERAYAGTPNPRFLLLAAEARARGGDFGTARARVASAWATGRLTPENRTAARTIAGLIDALEREANAAPPPGDSAAAHR